MPTELTAKIAVNQPIIRDVSRWVVSAVEGMMCLSIGFLLCSLLPVLQIVRMIPPGWLRKSWLSLGVLIVLFVLGYVLFASFFLHSDREVGDVLVAFILFLGSCFVAGVTFLSRQTAKDLLDLTELKQEIDVDPLTRLYNRRFLHRVYAQEIERAARYGFALAVLLIDIDHFKSVNDTYGHEMGDEVLRRVAKMISSGIRASDVPVRYGGEEILVLAPATALFEASPLAERLRESVASLSFHSNGQDEFHVSISIGIAQFRPGDSAATLTERADKALYQAKMNGRNRVCGPM